MIGGPGELGYSTEARLLGDVKPSPYRARVKDVQDPLKLGRVRVFIYALMSGPESDEAQWSDWVSPKMPVSSFGVPAEGAYTWVEFEVGDFDYPVYSGCFYLEDIGAPVLARGADDGNAGSDLSSGGVVVQRSQAGSATYPKNTVLVTPGGIVVELDDSNTDGRVRIRTPSGSFVELRDDGEITIRAAAGVRIGGDNVRLAGDDVVLGSSDVRLGSTSAAHPVPQGDNLVTAIQQLAAAFNAVLTTLSDNGALPVLGMDVAAAQVTLNAALAAIDWAATLSTVAKTD